MLDQWLRMLEHCGLAHLARELGRRVRALRCQLLAGLIWALDGAAYAFSLNCKGARQSPSRENAGIWRATGGRELGLVAGGLPE